LDILDVSEQIFLVFPLIEFFVMFGSELVHFFV
jgi:hypothetical protein